MNNLDRFFSADPIAFANSYFEYLHSVLKRIDPNEIVAFIATLLSARDRGATIFFIGNGGSAATASHFATDLAFGTGASSKPLRVVSLADNVPTMTAIANDFGYEDVFTRQLRVQGRPGDVLVAISASGNSPNLIKALEFCGAAGIHGVAITAFDGGKMRVLASQGIHVPTELNEYGPAEDAHVILNHIVTAFLRRCDARD